MDRFWGLRLATVFLLACLPFSAQDYNVVDVFIDTFNGWINIQNTKPTGTIDAHEEAIWKSVEKAWKQLDRAVKYE